GISGGIIGRVLWFRWDRLTWRSLEGEKGDARLSIREGRTPIPYRPTPIELEEALRRANRSEWTEYLRRLEERKKQPGSVDTLMANLQSGDWTERFIARHTLAALGSEAVEPLVVLARKPTFSPLQQTAAWLLRGIIKDEDTTNRLKPHASSLLCSRCLTHPCEHQVQAQVWLQSQNFTYDNFYYYGCRVCRQGREFLDCSSGAIAVLDQEIGEEWVKEDGVLRVNWLKRRSLFDFDWVEIRQATDEEVERFAVQVGNDTDEFRQPRYKDMWCVVTSECRLSENTMRILKSLFGQVQHHVGIRFEGS
ncbi:MAG: hypothetical protein MN733_25530, partial [Nitrososphaera sp.]|nr:hypothetical protein [Nitrososphaera sp.]